MTRTPALPTSDALFERFCRPWYSPADLARRGHEATRPDVEVGVAPPRTPVGRLHGAPRETLHYVRMAHEAILAGAVGDRPASVEWLDAFDRAHDAARVAALIAGADPDRRDNDVLMTAARVAAVLGAVLLARLPRAAWLFECPAWESAVYDHRSSSRVNVFHWAVRRLSADALDHPLRAKVDEAVETLARAAAAQTEG